MPFLRSSPPRGSTSKTLKQYLGLVGEGAGTGPPRLSAVSLAAFGPSLNKIQDIRDRNTLKLKPLSALGLSTSHFVLALLLVRSHIVHAPSRRICGLVGAMIRRPWRASNRCVNSLRRLEPGAAGQKTSLR